MIVAIGSDHRGFLLKQALIKHYKNIQWVDVGTYSSERCDFPEYAQKVVDDILTEKVNQGILLCGNGVGMSIVANRFEKIYAALAWNINVARLAKEHNNANILILPADFVSFETARDMVKVWSESKYLGGHYQNRIVQIDIL